MNRALMTFALAFLLTACAGSNNYDPSEVAPVRELRRADAKPPAKLLQACAAPSDLPARDLSVGEVERYWGKDRSSLTLCARKHGALKAFYRNRDRLLSGD